MPYVRIDPGILRTLMTRQEIDTEEIALATGCTKRRVQYVLAGQHTRVGIELARRFGASLGVPPAVLVTDPVERGLVADPYADDTDEDEDRDEHAVADIADDVEQTAEQTAETPA